jgi:hypothetical protein
MNNNYIMGCLCSKSYRDLVYKPGSSIMGAHWNDIEKALTYVSRCNYEWTALKLKKNIIWKVHIKVLNL